MTKLMHKEAKVALEYMEQVQELVKPISKRLEILNSALKTTKSKSVSSLLGCNIYNTSLFSEVEEAGIYSIGPVSEYFGDIPKFAQEAMAKVIMCKERSFNDLDLDLYIKFCMDWYRENDLYHENVDHVKTTFGNALKFSILAPTNEFIKAKLTKEAIDPIIFTWIKVNNSRYLMEIARW